jgi:hypothetical protein
MKSQKYTPKERFVEQPSKELPGGYPEQEQCRANEPMPNYLSEETTHSTDVLPRCGRGTRPVAWATNV